MMKKQDLVKSPEIAAVHAARDLLEQVPHLEASSVRREHPLGSHRVDGLIEFKHGDATYALLIEVKQSGAPRFVRSAVYQLKGHLAHARESDPGDSGRRWIPMLVSPYLSPESRSICVDHDVAYLDLVGNAYLTFDNVYIDRAVADRPKTETRALRSMFTPKAAAILRALLRDPARAWRVAELAKAADVSFGHVSNVRKALFAREWIEKQQDGIALVQPDALLKAWRNEYRRPAGRRIRGYTRFHGKQLDQRLSGKLNPEPQRPRAIYSSHSAAQWLAPFVRGGAHSFYADERGVEMLKEVLELTRVEKGANVTVYTPKDESLLKDAVQPAPGVFCTCPVVTYLDLWSGNDRDREAADHLASRCFPWL